MSARLGAGGASPPGAGDGFVAGLCSVTLRASSPEEVADVAAAAGLDAIEWGGDVHVPAGDLAGAAGVAARTVAAGLAVGSYGSYLFAEPDLSDDDIGRVVDTTAALGAPWVRVWCPFGVEPGTPADEVAGVAATLARIADRAAAAGCRAYVEFHGQTLTATEASAAAVLAGVADLIGSPAAGPWSAWQPPYWDRTRPIGSVDRAGDEAAGPSSTPVVDGAVADVGSGARAGPSRVPEDVAGIGLLAPRLAHLHVYAWDHDGGRSPLVTQAGAWADRLRAATKAGVAVAGPRLALLEFVPDDDPAAVAVEAATLRSLLSTAATTPKEEERA